MGNNSSPFTKKIHSGISIHSHAVRGVMVNEKGLISGFGEILFDQPILTDDITDPKPLIQAFAQIKVKAKFSSPYVALCFPEKYAFSRGYKLLNVDRSEISEAINWQIEKIFPFAKTDIYFDWKLLESTPKESLVLVTAVPKDILDHLRICLEQVSLYPISFEPSALAIGRILPATETKTAAILEIDAGSACTTLVVNRSSVATSTHNQSAGIDHQEIFAQVRQSLFTMINKYSPMSNGKPADTKVYLTGEKASPELAQSLSPYLNLPVELLSVSNVTPAYHLAYIAAKSHILPPGSDKTINLLPTTLQNHYTKQLNKDQAQKNFIHTLAFSVPALIICLLTYLIAQIFLSSLSKNILAAQAAATIPNLAGLNLAVVNQESQSYVNLFPLKISPENTLYQIISAIPANIIPTKLTYDAKANAFTLSGVAVDRADLIALKTALENLNLFKQVTLPLSALENLNQVNFALSLPLKP